MRYRTKANVHHLELYSQLLSCYLPASLLPPNLFFVPKTKSNQFKYDLALLLVVLIWGANFPILKQVLDVMHPFVVNVFRFTFSMIAIGIVLISSGKNRLRSLTTTLQKNPGKLIPLGILGYFLYQLFFILGIENTTAGNSALLMASTPAWTAIIAVLFTQESLGLKAILGLAASMAGAIFIVIFGTRAVSTDSEFLIGNVLIVVAAFCWGSYTALSRPVTRTIDPVSFTFLGLLLSFPLNIALAIPFLGEVDWSSVTILSWCAIIYSGGLSTGIAVVLWMYVVKYAGATNTAVFGNLVPVVALIGSYFILHEIITAGQIIGGLVILFGIFLMRLEKINSTGQKA